MNHSRFKCLKKQSLRNNWWNYYFFKHCTNILLYIFLETCLFAKWILMVRHLYFVECSKFVLTYHLNSDLKHSIWIQTTYHMWDVWTWTMRLSKNRNILLCYRSNCHSFIQCVHIFKLTFAFDIVGAMWNRSFRVYSYIKIQVKWQLKSMICGYDWSYLKITVI